MKFVYKLLALLIIAAMTFSAITSVDAQLMKQPKIFQTNSFIGLHECDGPVDCEARNCHTIDDGTLLHCDPIVLVDDWPPIIPECTGDADCDGIKDDVDQCKYDKETYNGFLDDDGCPDHRPYPPPTEPELTPIVVATMGAGIAISTVIISSLIIIRTKKQ